MSKRILIWVVVALTGIGVFIGLQRMKKAEIEAMNERHAILKALNRRSRNSVYLALRALRDGKISIAYSETINFDSPYSEVQPTIKRIVHFVNALPAEK